jgi:hypothetical protein
MSNKVRIKHKRDAEKRFVGPFQPGELAVDMIVQYGEGAWQVGFIEAINGDVLTIRRPKSLLRKSHADVQKVLCSNGRWK